MEQKDEESTIALIKAHGTLPIALNAVKPRTKSILSIMQENRYNLRILRIGCHSISNIAMEIQNCEILVEQGVIQCILTLIEDFMSDWRICWLACSSLWNLARCKLARDYINIRGVKLVLDIIDLHSHSPLVMQTSLGALSNLCIDTHIKQKIGNAEMIHKCLDIMDRHPYDAKVLTSACGLVTNLAYDENIAQSISGSGIKKIVNCMNNHQRVNHLQRNASAALSNLSATPKFVTHLVISDGVEALFAALKYHTDDPDVTQLATGALQNLSIYGPTTSLHVAATFCDSMIVRQCLLNKWGEFIDVNVTDIYGDTPLHVAVRAIMAKCNENSNATENTKTDAIAMADRLDVVQFLVGCGGDLLVENHKKETVLSLIKFENETEEKSSKTKINEKDNSIGLDEPRRSSESSSGDESMCSISGCSVVDMKIEMVKQLKSSKHGTSKKNKMHDAIHMAIDQGHRHIRIVQKRFINLVTETRKDIPNEIASVMSEYCHPLELGVAFRCEQEPSFKLAKYSKSKERDSVHVCMNFDDIDCSDLMDVDL